VLFIHFFSFICLFQTTRSIVKKKQKLTDRTDRQKTLPVNADAGDVAYSISRLLVKDREVKEAGCVYRPIVRSSPLKLSGMDHTIVTLQTHLTTLALPKYFTGFLIPAESGTDSLTEEG